MNFDDGSGYKPALVTWLDTSVLSGWHNAYQIDEFSTVPPMIIQSLGWVIRDVETEPWIVIAMSACERKAGELCKISRQAVVEIEYL